MNASDTNETSANQSHLIFASDESWMFWEHDQQTIWPVPWDEIDGI
jgi:hypothetical protein